MADFFIPGANTYDVRGAPTSLPSFAVKEKRFKAGQSKEKRRVKGFVASLLGPDTTLHGDTMHVSGKSPPAVRKKVERGALGDHFIPRYTPVIHPLYTFIAVHNTTLYTRSCVPAVNPLFMYIYPNTTPKHPIYSPHTPCYTPHTTC